MKNIPVVLRGTVQQDLEYNFGVAYPITKGDWQIALKSVGFEYNKGNKKDIPPPIDIFLSLVCNYVEETRILSSEETSVEPAILSFLHLNIKGGDKKLIEFPVRDFFQVNSPTQKFVLQIRDEHNGKLPEAMSENLSITVMLLFRRIN